MGALNHPLLARAAQLESGRRDRARKWATAASLAPEPVEVPNARTPLEVPNRETNAFSITIAPLAVETPPTIAFYVFHNDDGDLIETPIDEAEGYHAVLRDQARQAHAYGTTETWRVEGTLQGKAVLAVYTGTIAALRQLWPDADARKHMKAAGILGAPRFEVVPGTETNERPTIRRAGHHEPGVAKRIEKDLR